MQKKNFTIRPMELNDIESGMKLSNAEGWNQTEKDWKFLIGNPGNVCMVAECDDKVIGTTTAINYSNQVAWIAMVLVDKEYRGHGISKSLLAIVFKKLESLVSVKLDATPAGQQVYKKFDFKDEYLVTRMINSSFQHLSSGHDDIAPGPIQVKHIPEIIALDEIIFGANRAPLIQSLLKEYPGKGEIVKRNNSVTGFALGRTGNRYQQIGPVLASNPSDAQILIISALKKLTNQSVVVDVLDDKAGLLTWLSSIGFIKQRHFIRMYKKENTPGIAGKHFLICGPEFG